MGSMSARELIDENRWPLDDDDLIAKLYADYVREGVVVLPGFIRPQAIDIMVGECGALEHSAFRSVSRSSPYLSAVLDDVPVGDPRGHEITSSVGVIAYDMVPSGHLVRRLYESDDVMVFISRVLGEPILHRYADPFGALNISVMVEGDHLGWHFDMTDFVVSLAIQASESGGHFVNAPRIRTADDDGSDVVTDVLANRAPDRVRIEPMEPGTLMIFNGRWSMHKVEQVRGTRPRVVALLAYDRKAGTDSTNELKLARYGRVPA